MLVVGDDSATRAERAAAFSGRPVLVGSGEEIVDQIGAYAAAGADELIIPDWNLGPAESATDTLGQLFDAATRAGVVEAS